MQTGHLVRFTVRNLISLRYICSKDGKEPSTQQWLEPKGRETDIKLYNCAARRKVPLVLPNDNYVSWYTCGPTVYDKAHLGHASCYVKLDIIQRLLRNYFNLNVVSVMNITDIDDKIIIRSKESGIKWQHLARGYETEFWNDMRKLNVAMPNLKLRVTEQMPMIEAFIERLINNSSAYIGKDESVYFNTQKYPMYGKLQNLHEANTENDINKQSKADFALWKTNRNESDPVWSSPWGAGRPGWHIECSALASLVFGNQVDIHAGGIDLKFPHHENEEAQSCVYHNTQQWVNYWVHTGHLSVPNEKEKMSKSLKNTISITEMLDQYSANEFRMACVLSNYRNSMLYEKDIMETARKIVNKFISFSSDCQAYLDGKKCSLADMSLDAYAILQSLSYASSHIDVCFKDDFNTALAISILSEQTSNISRCINVTSPSTNLKTASCLDVVAAAKNFVQQILDTLGFDLVPYAMREVEKEEFDLQEFVDDLLNFRKIVRDRAMETKNQDLFVFCDELRNCLRQHGIEIKDHNNGSSWSMLRK